MATLEALQAAFQRYLLDEGGDFAQAVAPGRGIGVERRLAIYHHAYRARLVDTLRDSYGHLATYLGDDRFEREARAFVAGHPSQHDNLRWYGAALAPWLHERHPQDPDIAELAQLDWALRRAFDGPDAPVLTLADLAAVAPSDWGRIALRPHPTFDRLQLRFNTLALWHALDRDETPPVAAPLPAPTRVLIWRRALQPHFRSVGAFEAVALDALHAGEGYAATCDDLACRFPDVDVVREAGALLRRWTEEGLLSALAEARPRHRAPA